MPAPQRLEEYARAVLKAGRDLNVTPRGIVIAFATVFVESGWVMYANYGDPESMDYPYEAVGSDENSVGLFQQRAPWWGSAAQRMDPYDSARMFFDKLKNLDYNNPAQSPGWYAQQVQRSAFPDRYDTRMDEAQALYDRLTGSVKAIPKVEGPKYTEVDRMTGGGRSPRSRKPVNFLLHTQEADASAESLAAYCSGSNNVSYHYTLRDGILCAVVDTDYASWSVLDANAYTLNLCYAGSFAGWSRRDWLKRERDIAISAWVAVLDCRKYGIPTEVIKPPYGKARPGISDHKYVTECLGIGTHHDVGNNYPWDVFESYVKQYTTGGVAAPTTTTQQEKGGDFMAALSHAEQREVLDLLRVLAKVKFPSRSPLRHLGEGPIDTVAGIDMSTDGNVHVLVVKALAEAGVESQIELLTEIATADPMRYPDRQEDAKLARALLAGIEAGKQSA